MALEAVKKCPDLSVRPCKVKNKQFTNKIFFFIFCIMGLMEGVGGWVKGILMWVEMNHARGQYHKTFLE